MEEVVEDSESDITDTTEVSSKKIEQFRVVVNHEEQYSIWSEYTELPLGWSEVGVSGSKDECLSHIDNVWLDITPLSVRKRMLELNSNEN